MLGEPGRRPRRADRDEHRVAIEQAGHGEVAQGRSIRDIDQQTLRLQPPRRGGGFGFVLQRDESEPGMVRFGFADRDAAGALDQPRLGLAHRALGHHYDPLAGNPVEQRQRAQSHVFKAIQAPARHP